MPDDHTAPIPGARAAPRRRIRPQLVVFMALVAVLAVVVGKLLVPKAAFLLATTRSTPTYTPPVLAGQMLPGCTGGFYARAGEDVVVTMSAHCVNQHQEVRQADGTLLGVTGAPPMIADCPPGRNCSASDFMPLVMDPPQIAWGHLNLVDFTAGGYRTMTPDMRPLACRDLHVGDKVEVGGRNWYRSGRIFQIERYEFATDTIFPCMAIADIEAGTGDSGGAVLVNGQPAGITAREIDGYLAFTPLAEGMDALGLTLCIDPNCGLKPPASGGSIAP